MMYDGTHTRMNELTIMTYNIRHGAGMDDALDLSRPVAAVRRIHPDVLCLQEVDKGTRRSFGIDEPAVFARELGPLRHRRFVPSIEFEGGSYGNAILSVAAPVSVRRIDIRDPWENRSMIVCSFEGFRIVNTHLPLDDGWRMKALDAFRKLAQSGNKPTFFAGDWNDTPDSPFLQALGRNLVLLGLSAGPTFPANKPTKRIDYIAVDRRHADRVKFLSAAVADEPLASDHRPLVVRVAL